MPALAVPPSSPGTILAEAQGGGLVKSTDYGSTWARLPDFDHCEYINKIIINPVDANELLILSEVSSAYYGYDEILRSQDGGNTWTNIFSNRVKDIAVNKSDFDRIFAVGKNDASSVMAIHKTTNGGAEWSTFDITSVKGDSYAVDIDPTNDNTIYVGGGYYPSWSYVGCIFKSTDGGLSWTKAWEGKEDVKTIAVDPSFPARIYAGTHDGLYSSEDQEATWTLVLNEGVDSILVNPAAANEVFALDYYGVWFSTDWGATWQQMNTGLTTTPLCLDANWTNRILYAGMSVRAYNSGPTAKAGVFRTFLPGTPSMPTVSGFVKTAVGEGIPGVLLTFSAGGGTVTTGASGYYIQPVPAGWSGTVTPSKTGLIFAPADLTYTSVTSNQAGADYVGGVHAVSNPYIPSGLSRGEQGISYTFASGGSVCGLGHGVEYQFVWGDGTSSGWSAATSAAHAWPASGSYTLKVQARCSVETGLVSGWSEGISVTILSQYTEADKYAVGDVDGDGRDEAAVDFGTLGVWLWNEGKWVKMTPTDPEHLVAGNLDGDADDEIVGDFGADGIWRWNGSPWTLLSAKIPNR